MNKHLYIIIAVLVAIIFWREYLHQSRRASLVNHYENQIDLAIQNTSDELLSECERILDDACGL